LRETQSSQENTLDGNDSINQLRQSVTEKSKNLYEMERN
jgi:hypothetical protein